jgi:hypothetical protein
VTLILMHPGAVATERNVEAARRQNLRPYPGLIDTETSVRGMIQTIAQLQPEDSGRFLNYDGSTASW